MKTGDELVDNLIRSKIQTASRYSREIEPSLAFAKQTMVRIRYARRRRQIITYLTIAVLSQVPLMTRAIWMTMRGNHFHVSRWPIFGPYIAAVYQFLISPAGLYFLLFIGIGLAFAYTLRAKRSYNPFARMA